MKYNIKDTINTVQKNLNEETLANGAASLASGAVHKAASFVKTPTRLRNFGRGLIRSIQEIEQKGRNPNKTKTANPTQQ